MYKIGPLDLLEWIEATPPKLLGQPEILGKNWSVIYLTYLLLSKNICKKMYIKWIYLKLLFYVDLYSPKTAMTCDSLGETLCHSSAICHDKTAQTPPGVSNFCCACMNGW